MNILYISLATMLFDLLILVPFITKRYDKHTLAKLIMYFGWLIILIPGVVFWFLAGYAYGFMAFSLGLALWGGIVLKFSEEIRQAIFDMRAKKNIALNMVVADYTPSLIETTVRSIIVIVAGVVGYCVSIALSFE